MPQPIIYMDNHSTTRTDPRVVDAMLPYFTEHYGNAASINHTYGWSARDAVDLARKQVAKLLHCHTDSVIFTSGATEADNLAVKGVMHAAGPGTHLITSAAEHRAVLDPARRLQRAGFEVSILPVDKFGMVAPDQVLSAIQPNTALVSIMWANNEVGTINPVAEISQICREHKILYHCDAVQAAGRLPIDLTQSPIDLLSFTAHKFYGPKGIGALYVRRGAPRIKIEPLFDGGGHERHLRSGTLPVPLIVGFGKCCELANTAAIAESSEIGRMRDRLWSQLNREISGLILNGHAEARLPGNLNISVEGVDGEALMTNIKQVAVSSGSACTSADPEPSHVLQAMGVNDQLCRASIRFGLGRFNTQTEVDQAATEIGKVINRLRQME